MHANDLLTLIVQVILILALSRLVGTVFARFRQPQVIGEMVAGIMLGPSLLGLLAPVVYDTLFPHDSIAYLQILSQFGVIFFLFLIGLEFDPQLLRHRGAAAMSIGIASILVPFAVGLGLTFALYQRLFDDPSGNRFLPTALFMGAAISVTAFPVLARILTERNLHKSHVGAICITGAALNDVLAWCMLAVVVAVAQYNPKSGPFAAAQTAMYAVGYIAFMLLAVRPFLERLQRVYDRQGRLSQNVVAVIFLLVLASAYTTERIGIHALFGAFLMGCVMPKGSRFVRDLSEKLEDYTVVFLLPLFFAYAGISTDLTRIFSAHLWGYAAVVVIAACLGKIGGASVAARLCGQHWRESIAIGVLMNTRGLMELIILSIGLSLGVINDDVYAIMVLMTLVTTAMTTPLLQWVYPEQLLIQQPALPPAGKKLFTVLIPVSDPASGSSLLQLGAALAGPAEGRKLLALHLRRPVDRDAYRAGLDDASQPIDPTLAPLLEEAKRDKLEIEPISFVSRDVPDDIASLSRARQVDLLLMGFHRPVFGSAILGGTVHRVMTAAPADVAIYVSRSGETPKRILVPYLGSVHDRLALELAGRLAKSSGSAITALHVVPPRRSQEQAVLGAKTEVDKVFNEPGHQSPLQFKVVEDDSPVDAVLREAESADLVVIGVAEEFDLESHLFGFRPQRIALECPKSLLIVRKFSRARPT